MRATQLAFLIGLACLSTGPVASAQTIHHSYRGWYNSAGVHILGNDNYIAGDCRGDGGCEAASFNNWFVFDLAGVTDTITAATLVLELPSSGFASPTGSETLELFDVTTSIDLLISGLGSTRAFQDLGSGISYGTYTATPVDAGTLIHIPLNAAAIADLNAADDAFAFGGTITTLDDEPNVEFVFGGTGEPDVTLLLLETEPVECFLVVGNGVTNAPFHPGLHAWQTQIGEVRDFYAVTLEDAPVFQLSASARRAGNARARDFMLSSGDPCPSEDTSTATGPGWLASRVFTVQVLMWNPQVFPELPEQFSHGLVVILQPDGKLITYPYGTGTGMTVSAVTDVNELGQAVLSFPFTIPGL